MKMFLSAGLAAHALLGNFCMMPMAFAQEMEMPHGEHMEMDMTRVDMISMSPMSPAHCEHCAKMRTSHGDQMPQQSGCAGHCLSQVPSTTAGTATFNISSVIAVHSIPITIDLAPQPELVLVPPATAPPTSLHTKTTVLRL